MISVAEAIQRVTSGVHPVGTERVGLADALGRVLAEDVASRLTHPPAAVSAMDGYAVRAVDVASVPVVLSQIGQSNAGGGFDGRVGEGQTVRIFTGAPVPDGADAIVIQEDTDADGARITVRQSVGAGTFVRPQGLDFKQGDVLLGAGTRLTARAVGLAAAMNVPELTVRLRPRIAYLATGDELVLPGEPVGPSQIISSNTFAAAAYITAFGGEPVNLGIAKDNEAALRALLGGAREADLLLTLGGASVGDHDLVRKVLGAEGMKLDFFRIAMRPGKPLIFGHLGQTPVLGLPGNPVSVGVTSVIFLRPAMAVMLGLAADPGPAETALLGRDLKANDKRQDYLRSRLMRDGDGALVATPFGAQDSSQMATLARADCLVVRAPDAPPVKAGERVEIVRLELGISRSRGWAAWVFKHRRAHSVPRGSCLPACGPGRGHRPPEDATTYRRRRRTPCPNESPFRGRRRFCR